MAEVLPPNIWRFSHVFLKPQFSPHALFRLRDGLGKTDRSRTSRGSRFGLEPLEDRLVLSNYTVTNVNYSGTGSLGAAIAAADHQ